MKRVNHRKIAKLMANASKFVMMDIFKDWLKEKCPDVKITFHVGPGKSTYHQVIGKNKHKIVYGIEMVRMQSRSQADAYNWTNGKEVIDRKYFNGDLSLKNSMTSVVLHEFSHFIQCILGERKRNSVHNEKFYEILDLMHQRGYGERVYDYMNQDKDFIDLEYEEDRSYQSLSMFDSSNMSIGMKLTFMSKRNMEITGKIIKINKKTVNVQVPGGIFTVSYSLVRKVYR